MVAVDGDLVKMHTSVSPDHKITAGIDLSDDAGHTDRIKTLFLQILAAVIRTQYHQNDLLALKRSAAGHFFIIIDPKVDIGIRDDDHVVNGYYSHYFFLLIYKYKNFKDNNY